jgi:hypothetical protein
LPAWVDACRLYRDLDFHLILVAEPGDLAGYGEAVVGAGDADLTDDTEVVPSFSRTESDQAVAVSPV